MQAHINPHHQDSIVKGKEHNMQQLKRKQSKNMFINAIIYRFFKREYIARTF